MPSTAAGAGHLASGRPARLGGTAPPG